MLKFLILGCVVVWLFGALRGGPRRLIRNTTQLLHFVLWFVLLFLGGTMLPRAQWLQGETLLLGAAVAVWFAVSYWIAGRTAQAMSRK